MYLNTKYIRFFAKVFKYKIVFCISNMYFKYIYQKYCPSLVTHLYCLDKNHLEIHQNIYFVQRKERQMGLKWHQGE